MMHRLTSLLSALISDRDNRQADQARAAHTNVSPPLQPPPSTAAESQSEDVCGGPPPSAEGGGLGLDVAGEGDVEESATVPDCSAGGPREVQARDANAAAEDVVASRNSESGKSPPEASSVVNGLVDKRFLPPRKKASALEMIQRTQLCLTLLCTGNRTNSTVVQSALPDAMKQALSPSTSFMVTNLLRYISAPQENLQASTFAEKMGGSDRSAWYMFFGLLPHIIENPLLVWNSDMLAHLQCVLKTQCDNLDFMRQVRSVSLHASS